MINFWLPTFILFQFSILCLLVCLTVYIYCLRLYIVPLFFLSFYARMIIVMGETFCFSFNFYLTWAKMRNFYSLLFFFAGVFSQEFSSTSNVFHMDSLSLRCILLWFFYSKKNFFLELIEKRKIGKVKVKIFLYQKQIQGNWKEGEIRSEKAPVGNQINKIGKY